METMLTVKKGGKLFTSSFMLFWKVKFYCSPWSKRKYINFLKLHKIKTLDIKLFYLYNMKNVINCYQIISHEFSKRNFPRVERKSNSEVTNWHKCNRTALEHTLYFRGNLSVPSRSQHSKDTKEGFVPSAAPMDYTSTGGVTSEVGMTEGQGEGS
jgi:hypothetical protein